MSLGFSAYKTSIAPELLASEAIVIRFDRGKRGGDGFYFFFPELRWCSIRWRINSRSAPLSSKS